MLFAAVVIDALRVRIALSKTKAAHRGTYNEYPLGVEIRKIFTWYISGAF